MPIIGFGTTGGHVAMLRQDREFLAWLMLEANSSVENSREGSRKDMLIFFLMLMDMDLRYQKERRQLESNLFKWQAGFGFALAVIALMGVHWLGG